MLRSAKHDTLLRYTGIDLHYMHDMATESIDTTANGRAPTRRGTLVESEQAITACRLWHGGDEMKEATGRVGIEAR